MKADHSKEAARKPVFVEPSAPNLGALMDDHRAVRAMLTAVIRYLKKSDEKALEVIRSDALDLIDGKSKRSEETVNAIIGRVNRG